MRIGLRKFAPESDVVCMNDVEGLSKKVLELEKKLQALEDLSNNVANLDHRLSESSSDTESIPQILKRINAVQNLVDQIEIEIDKLEMRVSAIEHMGFRLRTGGP